MDLSVFYYLLASLAVIAVLFVFVWKLADFRSFTATRGNRLMQALSGAEIGVWQWQLKNDSVKQYWADHDEDGEEPRVIEFAAWTEFVHPADMPTVKAALDDFLKNNSGRLTMEFRVKQPQNKWRWVLCRGKITRRSRQNTPTYAAGTFIDISDQIETRDQLRYQALLLENINHAIISTNFEWEILSWNTAAAEMYGYQESEALQANLKDLLTPNYPEIEEAEMWQEFRTKGEWRGELIHHHKAGNWLRIFCTMTFALDENDVPKGIVMVNRDITHRYLDREKMESLTIALQSANTQLETRNQALEDKNRELTQFALKASHDLKQPLRTIQGFVESLQKEHAGLFDNDAQDQLEIILRNCRRMQSLITDLLQYARLGADSLPFEPVDLNLAVGVARMQLAEAVKKNDVDIVISDLPEVEGNKSLLIQVFQNLIGNSILHGEARKLEIAADQRDDGVFVSVSDDGGGIPVEFQPRIFQAFERGKTYDEKPGHGLGLAICRKIMLLHDGNIFLKESGAKGTVFQLQFPLRRAAKTT